VLFLGEQWNAHRYPGSDGPYWSLGFEVWYYVAFAAFIFVSGSLRWIATALVLAFIGPRVAFLFPAWLLGVLAYRLCAKRRLPSAIASILLVVPLAVLFAYQLAPFPHLQQFAPLSLERDRVESAAGDYLVATMFACHLVGFAQLSSAFAPWLERRAWSIRWIAGATFSLYLAHLPIMHLLAALSPWPRSSPWRLALLLVGTPAMCLLFAEISERRKNGWRRLIAAALPLFERPVRVWRGSA
jgi:peptidoglycan/LPS O-acetylase OafA/YrhL